MNVSCAVLDRKHVLAVLLLLASALSACGGSSRVAIVSPARPVYATCPRSNIDASRLLGHTLVVAQRIGGAAGCKVRVVEEDGRHLFGVEDFEPRRINVVVSSNTVVAIRGIG